MSQNDFTLANQSFPAFRADLNSALQALATNNSGGSAPSTTFANMWWYDTSNNIMYIRNEDNDAWIKFAELDQANDKFVLSGTLQLDDGTVSAPALTFNSDTNMGIYRGGTDILKFVTAGTDRLTIDASGVITSEVNGAVRNLDLNNEADTPFMTFSESGAVNFFIGESSIVGGGGAGYYDLYATSGLGQRFYTNALKRMQIESNGDISFYEDTGTTPKLFWDSSAESLQIGGTANIQAQGSNVTTFGNNFVLDSGYKYLTSGAANMLYFDALGNTMFFKASSGTAGNAVSFSETVRIDSSGNVGIGVVPETDWSSTGTALQIGGMGFICGHDGTGDFAGALMWGSNARQTSGWGGTSNWKYIANEQSAMYQTGDGKHRFFVAGAGSADATITWNEAVNIDNSGNLLVGQTTATTSSNGIYLRPDSDSGFNSTNSNVISLNRLSSDGTISQFRKDGITVGSIGVASSDLTIFSSTGNHKGLRFGNGQIVPTNNAGADSDNTTDLGGNSNRFKNLFLSGGLVLDDNPTAVGGAVTSKTLDDYEEGTWTPAIYYQNADDLTNSTNVTQSGMYTKIGNIVQATCYLKWSATDARANDNIGVSGFPFTASNSAPSSETRWIAPMVYQNTSYSTSSAQIFTALSNNATISNFVTAHGTGNLGDDFGQNTNMIVKFTLTYHTNQ